MPGRTQAEKLTEYLRL